MKPSQQAEPGLFRLSIDPQQRSRAPEAFLLETAPVSAPFIGQYVKGDRAGGDGERGGEGAVEIGMGEEIS